MPKPDEGKQKTKRPDTDVGQPAAPAPQQASPQPDTPKTNGDPQPPQPIRVQLGASGDGLEPFEEQTLAISREALTITKRTYWIAILGFLAAVAAATFVALQVKEMSYQTQIMGSQSESAAAGAAIGETNTRKQLAIAQEQAEAAQKSVKAIQRQTQIDQRAWIIAGKTEFQALLIGKPIKVQIAFLNDGRSPAMNVRDHGYCDWWNIGQTAVTIPSFKKPRFGNIIRSGGGVAVGCKALYGDPLTQSVLNDINAGRFIIRARGKVWYDDIFHHHHWSTVCAQYDAAFSEFTACKEEGEKADQDPE